MLASHQTSAPLDRSFFAAASLQEALAALSELGQDGAPLAGGTWTLRSDIRGETRARVQVGIAKLSELSRVTIRPDWIEIGAAVTHTALAAAMAPFGELRALALAASRSANPGVRALATVGGNLTTPAFAAADLVPALLALEAEIEISTKQASERLPLGRFLESRGSLDRGALLTRVFAPRSDRISGHARLPLRKAGDYPTAIVSFAAQRDSSGKVARACVAVGSVEAVARRWTELEDALIGEPLDAKRAFDLAEAHAHSLTGRDGIDAPGWYRVSVLPTLVRRAVEAALCA